MKDLQLDKIPSFLTIAEFCITQFKKQWIYLPPACLPNSESLKHEDWFFICFVNKNINEIILFPRLFGYLTSSSIIKENKKGLLNFSIFPKYMYFFSGSLFFMCRTYELSML